MEKERKGHGSRREVIGGEEREEQVIWERGGRPHDEETEVHVGDED